MYGSMKSVRLCVRERERGREVSLKQAKQFFSSCSCPLVHTKCFKAHLDIFIFVSVRICKFEKPKKRFQCQTVDFTKTDFHS